jgi:nicotinamide-nucleotide amidase
MDTREVSPLGGLSEHYETPKLGITIHIVPARVVIEIVGELDVDAELTMTAVVNRGTALRKLSCAELPFDTQVLQPSTLPRVQDEDLATRVAELLDGRSIATAESCTAGRIAEVLACVENATEFLRGGLVAYQDEVKRRLLGVTAESVLTAEAAGQMATGVARLMGAAVTVATTGVAGGDAEDGNPPGTVYIASCVDGAVATSEHHFEGTPEDVCNQARRQALLRLIDVL